MKRTYKKKSNLINKTGYTPGYDTEKNPVNYIPSEDITMANTPYPLYATPLDEDGNPIGKGMIMQPGGEYKFPNAAYVAETPMFAKGGEKSDWISAKISTLVREGYPQKQAVAIAYSMYEDMKKENGGFQLPMYQFGNTFPGSTFPKPKFSADPNIATPEQFSEQMNKITEVNPGKYGLGKDPNYVSPLSEESLTAGEDFKKRTDEMGKAAGLPQDFSKNIFGETTTQNTEDKSKVAPPDIKGGEPFQFFNPYSGFDIPTAASTLGSSIESGDTLGTVASGLKLATGLARNFFGGMGQERRKNYLQKEYYDKQREGMTGAGREQMLEFGGYYQEGGMEEPQGGDIQQQVAQALQQGMSPEEVMQQLVQMGMPEDQAVALIQGVMQQMQPSTPQLRRGGMMYYEDGGEEDDEDGGEYQDEEEYGDLINKYPNRNPNISRVEDTENKTDWYEEGMDRDTYYGFKNQLESSGYKSVPKEESKSDENKNEQKEESYDKNSARDTWVAKTGLPWSEAKRLGYTDGSAKDNMKLLSELNDPRFKKEHLRKRPLSPAKSKVAEDNKTYYGGTLKEVVIEAPRKKAGASRFMFTSDKAYQDYLKANKMKAPDTNTGILVPMPAFDFSPKQKEQPMFRQAYQDGGEQQVAQQVAQAMQQGMQPQEAISMLMESGMTEDQALQMVQAIIEQLQQQTETPQLRKGGEMIKRTDGSYSRRGLWDNIRDNIGSGKKPTKEMLEQEAKIKREYQEGGMEPGADPTEMIMQQVAQMLDQGADPQQIMEQLIQMGIPQEVAQQMIEEILQEIEGGETEMEEPEEGTPQMSKGGKYMRALVGKTIKNYTYNPKTDSYIVSYE